jgi:glycosyltransferase involved in cell wall biosynthesis
MRFSVITPTFNRRSIVQRSIDSSLEFARAVGDSEVVVIDDASQDGTVDMLRTRYAKELTSGILKLVERQRNGGSTVAKADGARRASGDWLVFLDSDDELLPEASRSIPGFIGAHLDAPVFLYRCIDQEGHPIGPPVSPRPLSFDELLAGGTPGECLPVISRIAFLEFPTDNDILAFEFMSLLRIVRAYGPAMLSDAVARRYHMDGADRLTSRTGNLRRARQHARGFGRMLQEFGPMMPFWKRLALRLRILCYSLIAACVRGHP